MSNWKQVIVLVAALVGGFVLSFVGFGVLWAGARWTYQLLMFFPFLLFTFAIKRLGGHALLILIGAIPIAAILVQARDKDDSHLMSILLVVAWAMGILLGDYLSDRFSRKPGR